MKGLLVLMVLCFAIGVAFWGHIDVPEITRTITAHIDVPEIT